MSLEAAQERHRTIGRNDECPCGSKKKYKRCHQAEDDQTISTELKRLSDIAAAEAEAAAEEEKAKKEAEGKPGAKKTTSAKSGDKGSKTRSKGGAQSGGRAQGGAKPQSLPRRGAV